jgi:hypothetical protein
MKSSSVPKKSKRYSSETAFFALTVNGALREPFREQEVVTNGPVGVTGPFAIPGDHSKTPK